MSKVTLLLLALAALLAVECNGDNNEDSNKLVERDTRRPSIFLNGKNDQLKIQQRSVWKLIQQRVDGSVDFYRNWDEYVEGFGDSNTNFWMGLEAIHRLSEGGVKLRVDLWFTGWGFEDPNDIINNENGKNYTNEHKYAEYNYFSIGSAATNYSLHVSGYHGTAGDALEYHNGYPFSTKDRDNDGSSLNCAVDRTGAWWYYSCSNSNLNGEYGGEDLKGPNWDYFTGWKPASRVEMKILI